MAISLLTMGAGNIGALQKTLESFNHVVDEIVYGEMLIFDDDIAAFYKLRERYNIKSIPFTWNYLFENGFSSLLNALASVASNDIVLYSNTGEAIEKDNGIVEIVSSNPECNVFYFDHAEDKHRWARCYNRKELSWGGMIHEELGKEEDYRPYHKMIYRMMDHEKDMDSPFKAKVMNDLKELVYFQQYMNIIDFPERLGNTNEGWIRFASENYDSFKKRLNAKGDRYKAIKGGDFRMYMNDCLTNPEFENERFESSIQIEFQGDPKFLGKK